MIQPLKFNLEKVRELKNDIKGITPDRNLGNYTLVMLYFLKDYKIEDLNNVKLDKYIEKANQARKIARNTENAEKFLSEKIQREEIKNAQTLGAVEELKKFFLHS